MKRQYLAEYWTPSLTPVSHLLLRQRKGKYFELASIPGLVLCFLGYLEASQVKRTSWICLNISRGCK